MARSSQTTGVREDLLRWDGTEDAALDGMGTAGATPGSGDPRMAEVESAPGESNRGSVSIVCILSGLPRHANIIAQDCLVSNAILIPG